MNEHDDVMGHEVLSKVRESFAALRMDRPVEQVFARGRVRRRRQLSALTGAAAATTGVAATMTLTLGGPGLARPSPPPPGQSPARLAAFSVTDGPGGSTMLTLHKGPQYGRLDPSALRRALARHGIPALVTVGTFCRARDGATVRSGPPKQPSYRPGGTPIVLKAAAMPPGTRWSIGYFPGVIRMALIKDGVPLSCSSTSHQPAAHITPSGTPIRGRR